MNASLQRLFGNSQKWNISQMWWFRGHSPITTYKGREHALSRAWGALSPSQLRSHHFQSLHAVVMVCCFPQGESCTQWGLEPCLPLRVRILSQTVCSTSGMTGLSLGVPWDHEGTDVVEQQQVIILASQSINQGQSFSLFVPPNSPPFPLQPICNNAFLLFLSWEKDLKAA